MARDYERKRRHNADFCAKADDHEFVNTGGYSKEFYGWAVKTANIGASF